MMKFWKRLLAVPEDDKVTEKCMTRVLICSICSVLLCVVCLASTTWAWYETQETYEGSVIRGGSWQVETTTETTEVTEETTVPETTGETEPPVEETTEAVEESIPETTEAIQTVAE